VAKKQQRAASLADYTRELTGQVIHHELEDITPLMLELIECSHGVSQSGDICKPASWVFYRIEVCFDCCFNEPTFE